MTLENIFYDERWYGEGGGRGVHAMWETWVLSLGWEDLLGKGMVTHSSILAWKIPMDRGAWAGYSS